MGVLALNQNSIETLADLNGRIRNQQALILDKEQPRTPTKHLDSQVIMRLLQEFDPLWEAMTTHEGQRMLQLIVQRIDDNGAGGGVDWEWQLKSWRTRLANVLS